MFLWSLLYDWIVTDPRLRASHNRGPIDRFPKLIVTDPRLRASHNNAKFVPRDPNNCN